MSIHYYETAHWPAYVGCCLTKAAFRKEMARLKVKEDVPFNKGSGCATTHYFHNPKSAPSLNILVCIDAKDMAKRDRNAVCALVAHEAVHVWQNIAEEMGGDHGKEDEAYAVQYFTNLMLNNIYSTE